MFEELRCYWHESMFLSHTKNLHRAIQAGNLRFARVYAESALKSGRKALKLSEKIGARESGENLQKAMKSIQNAMKSIQNICDTLHGKRNMEPAGDPIRQEVKRQYVQLASQMAVAGGNSENFIADRMIDTYRIAISRLDKSPEALRMIYVDNDMVPQSLKEVISQYLGGKLTREQTIQKLTELKSKTEQYVRELGTNPDKAQYSATLFARTPDLETRLKADIIADSMRDDGSINQRELFMNIAEISLFSNLKGLAKKLQGRQPKVEELVAAQIDAYRTAHTSNPSIGDFKDEKDFEKWISRFEQARKSQGDSYLQAALPVYNAVAERLAKNN